MPPTETSRRDYIPKSDKSFLDWVNGFTDYLSIKASSWNINADAVTKVQTLLTDYRTAYTKTLDANRGKVDIYTKNKTRLALESTMRAFVQEYITYSSTVTDDDRIKLGTPIHNKIRTPVPPPSTIPEFEVDTSILQHLRIYFRDQGTKKRGKPYGVAGAEIRWDIRETPTLNQEELTHSEFSTSSPYTLEFSGNDRGKMVYFALRWQNGKGQKGAWSEILNAVIP
ncbi:hypothetical protein FACS1894164_10880 [Spirochaetia bacterium]|nr:hypothetical protein FACS1894164_10880 [Spirochaetia bacterium]